MSINLSSTEKIKEEVESNDVLLFMKGTPMFPQCGFSAAVVQILSQMNIKFKGINVLEDDQLRQGVKDFTNWPTIPQLYVKGEFIGGCDIIREMAETGELEELFSEKEIFLQTPNLNLSPPNLDDMCIQKIHCHTNSHDKW